MANVKEDPQALALRAKPRAVTRLNRRTIMVVISLASAAVLGATLWGLHVGTGVRTGAPEELHEIGRVPQAEGLATLPKDYAKLGPPLGELGRPVLREERAGALPALPEKPTFESDPEENAARADRLRDKQEAAQADKARVFFELSQQRTRHPDAKALSEGKAMEADGREGNTKAPSGAGVAIYASGHLESPRSPDELLAGTIIAAALVTGINSDLPGEVVATVTENVYDSVTGERLLVPQGSRLLGQYGSSIAFGQQRILLVWTRLLMPDGSSITLDHLNAADVNGQSGLADKVDFHWYRLFAAAGVSTLIAAGAELASPAQQVGRNGTVVIAARQSVQDSITEVGQQITRRNLDVQPTITIRTGFPIRVIINRDLVLRTYGAHAAWASPP